VDALWIPAFAGMTGSKNNAMLKELIDQFYFENQKNREQTRFYITDAGKCPRAVFFKFKNAPREPIQARMMRIFEHGEHIHRNIFSILYRLKIGVVTEVAIPQQEIVSGRADAILCINGENYVLDIKSINSMLFRKLTEPKEDNIYQVQLYMHFFNVKKGILLYVDKDQQEMKEFYLDYDKVLCDSLMEKFKGLKGQVEACAIPERLADYPKNWQCNYCAFKNICKSTDSIKWNLT
jgi:CRISPR/Cas system-associated exonuclease Cas4 (RecB family)